MFITEEELKKSFGDRTFSKGLKYFKDGYVEIGMRKGNKLIGRVLGSSFPYRVKVEVTSSGVHSECTCPVGRMCKHGVALFLQWMHSKDSIVDYNEFLALLQEKSKEELIEILDSIVEDEPELLLKFFSRINDPKKNLEAIKKSVDYTLNYMDYYAVPGAVRELEKVRIMGEKLAEDGYFKDAVEIYLLLIEKGVDAYGSVDDSDEVLGSFIMDCIENFKDAAKHLDEEQKSLLIFRIINIVEMEDYGLETDEMLVDIATERNIDTVRDELLKRVPEVTDRHSEYRRNKILNLLSSIYEKLALWNEAVSILKGAGLKTGEDYLRIASILSKHGKDEDALEYVRTGLELDDSNSELNRLYFRILDVLLEESHVRVNVEEALNVAMGLLSSYYFKTEAYNLVKKVFIKMGEFETLTSKIKQKCNANTVISVLLIEKRIDEVIEFAISSSSQLRPERLAEIADIARKLGKFEEAKILTFSALKHGLREVNASFRELIRFFVANSDSSEVRKAMEHIRSISVAKAFMDSLHDQECIAELLRKFLIDLKKDEIKKYTVKIDKKQTLEICQLWINEFVNRSHVYYNDVLDILGKLREIVDEVEWRTYISGFLKVNKGKKKLVEMMKDAKLA